MKTEKQILSIIEAACAKERERMKAGDATAVERLDALTTLAAEIATAPEEIATEAGGKEMSTSNTTHGGRRAGAGRKPSPVPRRSMTLSVGPDTILRANRLRSDGVKINKLVEMAIREEYDCRRYAAESEPLGLEVQK